MKITGALLKMETRLEEPVHYTLRIGSERIAMNELLGSRISLKYENEIYCIGCGRKTNKSFAQGYCYNCFLDSPEVSECILRPELCLAHEGKGRDTEWEKEHHFQEHIVYLAWSSAVKVGVTRAAQIPTRWIDQGASAAIGFAKTPYRQLAGKIEMEMKKYFADKTPWQKMLKSSFSLSNDLVQSNGEWDVLIAAKEKAKAFLPAGLRQFYREENSITVIHYPIMQVPQKVKNIVLEKQNFIEDKLTGIKGQYLLFESGSVLNVRKHSGYVVSICETKSELSIPFLSSSRKICLPAPESESNPECRAE